MMVERDDSLLLVVDVQQRLAPAISGRDEAVAAIEKLVKVARRLDVPVLATEQYPKGLGPTIEPIASLLPNDARVEKLHFNASRESTLQERLQRHGRRQILLCGMEAHICVAQTALGLRELGYEVFMIADAVGSRRQENRLAALDRLSAEGVRQVTSEMVLFEWLGRSDDPAFKDMLELIR